MKILLCNDDGIMARGLAALREALVRRGHDVRVVAPDRERSAAGHSITFLSPLSAKEVEIAPGVTGFSIGGTPADCARIGCLEIFPEAEFVVSGINSGANTGMDTLYSGTVAAAMEGVLQGRPALAVSTDRKKTVHYETAAAVAAEMVAFFEQNPMDSGTMCNLNVPNLPLEDVKGLRIACLNARSVMSGYEKVVLQTSGTWYGARVEPDEKGIPGSDRALLDEGYATATYLGWRLEREPPRRALPDISGVGGIGSGKI